MPSDACFPGGKGDIHPQEAIQMLLRGIDHRQVAVSKLGFRYGDLEGLHLFGLRIETRDLHLRHVAVVNPSFLIHIDLQTALSDLSEPSLWNAVLHNFAGFGIEFSKIL